MSGWIYVPPDVTDLDGAGLATDAELAAHAASTAPIHGITDTADLITTTSFASEGTPGIVTLATIAEMSDGQDNNKPPSVKTIAKSIYGIEIVGITVFEGTVALATGDGKQYFRVPTKLNGWDLIAVAASVLAESTLGTPTIQVARGRQASAGAAHSFVDMLSTLITIDANEFDSKDAATAAVINTSNNDVATGDLIRIDIDVAGTAATGLFVNLSFQVP